MTPAVAEVRERHPISASDPCVHGVDLGREAMGRKPLGHRVGIEERSIQSLGGRAKHAVKPDGVGGVGHVHGTPLNRFSRVGTIQRVISSRADGWGVSGWWK